MLSSQSQEQDILSGPAEKIPIESGPSYVPIASSFTAVTPHTADNYTKLIVPEQEREPEVDNQKPTKYVPIDWGLKTKLRILTLTKITGNGLKSCQEASGITRQDNKKKYLEFI